MNIIFLDIDGVLNTQHSISRCQGYIGIDNDKVKRLKQIVTQTNAKIVLCSSWKSTWERVDKEVQKFAANYLDKKLRKEKLYILDKTTDHDTNRGEGIHNWISSYKVENWVVLDNEIFDDYDKYEIMPHLVQTSYETENGGVQDSHVKRAIEILTNGPINMM